MIGDSVRKTLINRVNERLGNTETIIFSRNSFISEELTQNTMFEGQTRGILLINGFIPHYGKLIPVFVWGVDDMDILKGTAKINKSLFNELKLSESDAIILRLPSSGIVPSGSLFVSENYTTSLRLDFKGIIGVKEGGNISLKNEHSLPLNIFVNRHELANTMEMEGKINLILTNKELTINQFQNIWNYKMSGISVNRISGYTEITSDRIFLQEKVVETIVQTNNEPNRLFSYLANSIENDGKSVPYSFVTALDRYQNEDLQKNEIILSDYTANRLQAKTGDTILVTYYISHDLKTLKSDSVLLQVKKIVPITELSKDKTLSADFPGLSDVERCTDWDSDLPINMNLITDEDEKYWNLYKSLPKALLPYHTVAAHWGNPYGNATSVRVADINPDFSALDAEMFGIKIVNPRKSGLYAALNGVDFSSLFLALGFFIIISAMLLMIIPLSEMFYQRKHEFLLLKALGYTQKRISKILWKESAPVVLVFSIIGVFAGIIYTTIIMWLLGTLWKGATHTEGFTVYPSIITIFVGFPTGILLSLGLLWITIKQNLKEKQIIVNKYKNSTKNKKILAISSSVMTIFVIAVNLFFLHSVVIFVIGGVVLLVTAYILGDYLICVNGKPFKNFDDSFTTQNLIWATLLANRKQAVLSFFALAIGIFIVFSVGLNRKGFADSSQLRTGTGGFSLWGECSVPVYHNMNTQMGREKLSLTDLPENTEIVQCLRYNADDASCLNLNKVVAPTVLGIDMNVLKVSDFRIEQNIFSLKRDEVFEQMKIKTDSVYPALVDATVLTWSLMKQLGDTLWYENDKGKNIAIKLIGTLSNSIFQGNILIDKTLFSEIWEEITGSEVFLVKTNESEKDEVQKLISQALNEFGIKITSTNDRLKQFNSVTDTYLTIFLTLGGLGLLLGIMSFVIVIRKNLAKRAKEINMYKVFGFSETKIKDILYKENLLVPLYAIVVGVICSFVGVSMNFANVGVWIWLTTLLFILFFVGWVVVFVRREVENLVNRKLKY